MGLIEKGVLAFLFGSTCGCKPFQYQVQPPTYFVETTYPSVEVANPTWKCPKVAVPFGTGHHSVNTGATYNHPFSGNLHNGIDFIAEVGTTVIAPAAGVVVATTHQTLGSGGRIVAVDAGVDKAGNHIFFLTAHLARFFVTEGQYVNRGDELGEVGTSGGQQVAHLHFSGFTSETGRIRKRPFGRFFLGDHDLLDPALLSLGGSAFLPFDPLHTYGDLEGHFQGFTHPLCAKAGVHPLVK